MAQLTIVSTNGTVSVNPDPANPCGFDLSATVSIQAGANVTITGSGTAADPYIVNATGGAGGSSTLVGTTATFADGNSIDLATLQQFLTAGTNVTLTGTGTQADPWVVNATVASLAGTTITFADGSSVDLSTLGTVIQAGTNVTITGTGTAGDPYIINATVATYDATSGVLTFADGQTINPYVC